MKFIHKELGMLTTFGGFLYRARWGVFLFVLALLIGAGFFSVSVFGLLTNSGYTDPNSSSAQADRLLDSRLGGASPDVIILIRSDTLQATDPAFSKAATDMLTRLKKRSEVASLVSYYSTHSQNFLSSNGHETFALLQLVGQNIASKGNEYTAIKPLITSSTLKVTIGGHIPVNLAINHQASADLERAEIITFPILAVLLLLVFGGVIAAGLPLLIGGTAILGAFAALRFVAFFTDVSVFAINVVTMLGLGLAVDYALFLVTRFREELVRDENDVRGALERTMATAGRTVLFSGLTVSTGLLSLLIFPLGFLRSMGMGAIAAILAVMLTSLTLLPAILALLGKRINALSFSNLFRHRRAKSSVASEHRGAWYRLSETVMRRPILVGLIVLALLCTLGWPFLHIKFASSGVTVLPVGQETRVVSERLSQDFSQEGNSQLIIAITMPGDALSASNLASLDSYVKSIKAIHGVVQVSSLVTVDPSLSLAQYQLLYAHPSASPELAQAAAQLANGRYTKIVVALQPADRSADAITIVNKVRALHTPSGLVPLVDGITPAQIDLLHSLGTTLPYAFLIIFVAVFVLLFLMTGSLVMPLKAIILNILSLVTTFGGLVWIFQDGHLQDLLSFQSVGSIDATQPVLIFAIAFGLSMDYEVFLLSRIKERFDQTGNNRQAVSSGLQNTGWLITSAALLLAIVLGSFGTSKVLTIQEIGVGLCLAILMDATLIRMLLVPATMRLLGNLNWWAPAPLHRLWQRIGLAETVPTTAKTSLPTPELSPETPTQVSV
jgi:trehalose monomycolate/heme transporter